MSSYTLALTELSEYVRHDKNVAWAWHSFLAVAIMDEGLDRAAANRAAAKFMRWMYNVDVAKWSCFEETQESE